MNQNKESANKLLNDLLKEMQKTKLDSARMAVRTRADGIIYFAHEIGVFSTQEMAEWQGKFIVQALKR